MMCDLSNRIYISSPAAISRLLGCDWHVCSSPRADRHAVSDRLTVAGTPSPIGTVADQLPSPIGLRAISYAVACETAEIRQTRYRAPQLITELTAGM